MSKKRKVSASSAQAAGSRRRTSRPAVKDSSHFETAADNIRKVSRPTTDISHRTSEPTASNGYKIPEPTANRTHKNRLFLDLFKQPKDLLDLYNAVNGSHHNDPSLLEINTLEDVLYLSMKNDISFLIGSEMNLYEAQSTWNPNMPLRGLFYFARLYQGYVDSHQLDIYSNTQLKLPFPRYVVFYNGTRAVPERTRLFLSASYEGNEEGSHSSEGLTGPGPDLECTATVININYGQNKGLMDSCRRLYEYSYLISRIRYHLSQGMTLKGAADGAIEDCLRENVLVEYLTKHRAEATMSILTEYDEEKQLRYAFRDGKAEGRTEGRAEGRAEGMAEGRADGIIKGKTGCLLSLICRKLKKGKSAEQIAEDLDEDISAIRPLYEAALPYAPEFDYEKIYQLLYPETEDITEY